MVISEAEQGGFQRLTIYGMLEAKQALQSSCNKLLRQSITELHETACIDLISPCMQALSKVIASF